MQRCLTVASYNHICDIYEKKFSRDPYSEEEIWSWELIKSDIKCAAYPFINGGMKGSGSMEKFDTESYISNDYVKLKTKIPVLKSQRVTNIRALDGTVVWAEEELDWEPTIFNVDGCAPSPNAFTGIADEYVSVLNRSSPQRMD